METASLAKSSAEIAIIKVQDKSAPNAWNHSLLCLGILEARKAAWHAQGIACIVQITLKVLA
jgi:hypothetical protein